MSQVVGFPGGGFKLAKGCAVFCGFGSPNSSSTPDVIRAGQGSLYLQQDGAGAIWVCSVSAVQSPNSPIVPAVWVSK
jgi:hypothetical protein